MIFTFLAGKSSLPHMFFMSLIPHYLSDSWLQHTSHISTVFDLAFISIGFQIPNFIVQVFIHLFSFNDTAVFFCPAL
jgi:hypothetical protein